MGNKITIRNYITASTITVFLFMILYAVIENPLVLDNPLVTFVLGTFAPIVMMENGMKDLIQLVHVVVKQFRLICKTI